MYKTTTIVVLLGLFISGCSKDPYNDYLGLWQRVGSDHKEVLEIAKDGDTYLINDNILQSKDFYGHDKKPMVLKKQEGQLSVETGLGSLQLGLSADKNTLHVSGRSYSKISTEQLSEIRSQIKEAEVEREKNKSLCNAMNEEYKKQKRQIHEASGSDWKKRNEQGRLLLENFRVNAKEIPTCVISDFLSF